MTLIARLLSTSMLVTVLATTGAASASTMFNPRQPSPTGSYLAGQAALSSMETDAAARYMRDALEGEYDHPQVIQTAVIAFASNGQIADAASAARHMLEVDPGNELARLIIAAEELKQGDFPGVAEELDGLGADSFAAITGSILRAWALVGENKLDDALKSLDPVSANGLDDFLVFHRALMADVAGDRDRAIEFAAKAYEIDPLVARIVEAYSRMLGNAGSFFHNPIVAPAVADAIPGVPRYPQPDGSVKLSAAWLIDACGLKGTRDGNAGIYEKHALVVVNHGGATYADIARLSARVKDTVRDRFGVTLTQEPLEL